jgi:hypothetical protein
MHDLRWVVFDDERRLVFATTYDGDWDKCADGSISKPTAALTTPSTSLCLLTHCPRPT